MAEASEASGFDSIIEPYHRALATIINGSPDDYKAIYSKGDDITLGNPFGPVVCGRDAVFERLDAAASNYSGGEVTEIETVSKCVSSELAYLVEVERVRARIGGSDEMAPISLRVTSIFRPEEGTWKLVHRHADPITTPRPPESVLEK